MQVIPIIGHFPTFIYKFLWTSWKSCNTSECLRNSKNFFEEFEGTVSLNLLKQNFKLRLSSANETFCELQEICLRNSTKYCEIEFTNLNVDIRTFENNPYFKKVQQSSGNSYKLQIKRVVQQFAEKFIELWVSSTHFRLNLQTLKMGFDHNINFSNFKQTTANFS